jgi:hypothetical protein
MPTPFTHLEVAQRLLCDDQLAPDIRRALKDDDSAYLLGSVAADARAGQGGERSDTHFYFYDRPITRIPWRVMLEEHPQLQRSTSPAQRAFLAGYVAHLAVDELWTMEMVRERIAFAQWGTSRSFRFHVLNLLLAHMDERDLARLEAWQPASIQAAKPEHWLPFLDDDTLIKWRDLIYEQIKPEGVSLTLTIIGGRVGKKPDELRAELDSPTMMQEALWDNVPRDVLADIEARTYVYAREQVALYWQEYS